MSKKLLYLAEGLIGYKLITSVTGSVSDRAKRIYQKLGEEVGNRLKEKDTLPEGSNIYLELKWGDERNAAARQTSLALEELKQVNPEAYKQFEKIKEKHKKARRGHLEFRVIKGDLQEEIYIDAVKSIFKNITSKEAEKIYEGIIKMSAFLGKSPNIKQTFLLPE